MRNARNLCAHCATVSQLRDRFSFLSGLENRSYGPFAVRKITDEEKEEKVKVYSELTEAERAPCAMTRKIGTTWIHVTEEPMDSGQNEDGDRTYTNVPLLVAETKAGREYVNARHFANVVEAKAHMDGLPADFDPHKAEDWYFNRNVYGSAAYVADGDEEAQIEREREPAL